ncbi:hypothetical protein BDA96_06G084200 [Sorghum bicolor]|uniref:Uncharacterized protein n=2 Tax=Sorghum bicolor TaxID=4558 RepID=A0A921QSG7_SORBI|nr:hypothetical protein BDA96_06G084200 [Sorghum bicolor]KXG26287.1 hypothetical protein SORBI_3006G076700 [Sorghum bicolor]
MKSHGRKRTGHAGRRLLRALQISTGRARAGHAGRRHPRADDDPTRNASPHESGQLRDDESRRREGGDETRRREGEDTVVMCRPP